MTEQHPVSGGSFVLGPDGVSKRVTFRDRPQTANEKTAFAKYAELSPLEILRRLHAAEFNASVREEERDQWKRAAREADTKLAAAERKLATYPPDGYAVPKVVADLLTHAEAHGWRYVLSWSSPEGDGARLAMEIGRDTVPADGPTRGTKWRYQLAWGLPEPGLASRIRAGLAKTPDRPQWHDAPSLKKIREVIAANPMPEARES